MIPRIITPTTVTVHLDGNIIVANNTHPAFAKIKQAAEDQDWVTVLHLVDVGAAIEEWSDGEFVIRDSSVFYMSQRVPDAIEKRIVGCYQEGVAFEHLLAFYRNLNNNPSRRSVQELYAFLEHESIPIGEDGCFYAYKSVRDTWMDWHSNSCLNTVGATLEMARNNVDDDANRGCSYGYHVGSLQYASSFGSTGARLLIVKVNPADVVSVPHDCAHQKVRTSKYTVIQEYTGPLPEHFWSHDNDDSADLPEDTLDIELSEALASSAEEIEACEIQLENLHVALAAAVDARWPAESILRYNAIITSLEDQLEELEDQHLLLCLPDTDD